MSESESLKNLLFGLVKQAKADIERKFVQAGIVITPFEHTVLSILKYHPKTLAEVAKKMGVRPPSVQPYIDALEKKHLLSRRVDNQDRRKIQLELTASGESLLSSILKDHPEDILVQAFHKLSRQKKTELLFLLQELTDNLNLHE